MTRNARIGVIGTGWWSTCAHIPALVANPEAEGGGLAEIRPVSKALAGPEIKLQAQLVM